MLFLILSIKSFAGLTALGIELANYGKRVDEELERIDKYKIGFHVATAIERDRLQNAIRQIFPSSAGSRALHQKVTSSDFKRPLNMGASEAAKRTSLV